MRNAHSDVGAAGGRHRNGPRLECLLLALLSSARRSARRGYGTASAKTRSALSCESAPRCCPTRWSYCQPAIKGYFRRGPWCRRYWHILTTRIFSSSPLVLTAQIFFLFTFSKCFKARILHLRILSRLRILRAEQSPCAESSYRYRGFIRKGARVLVYNIITAPNPR